MRLTIPLSLLNDIEDYGNSYLYPLLLFVSRILRSCQYAITYMHKYENRYMYKYPNNRYLNPRYYSRYKHIQIPKGYKWTLITLTVKRDIPLLTAWSNIGKWVSLFLHNMRNYFRSKGVRIHYIWVIEPHKDLYPHVHILITYPFLSINQITSWWKWSEPQGVDVKFIGDNPEAVKSYVLKYLLKGNYADFYIDFENQYIEISLISFLLWWCRVRLIGRSRFMLLSGSKPFDWYYVGITPVDYLVDEFPFNLPPKKIKTALIMHMLNSPYYLEYDDSRPPPSTITDILPEDLDF